jgi:hypothetical protein
VTLWRVVLGLAIATLALPALSAAQGLGDIAARAKADREQRAQEAPQPVRTFTNDDLPERDPSEDSEDEVTPDEGDESPPEDRASRSRARDSGGPDEAEIERSRNRVRRLEAMVEELQQRLNPMSTTYIYGGTGGPVGGVQSDEERAVRRQLDAAQQQLDQARESLAEAESRGGSGRRDEPAGY